VPLTSGNTKRGYILGGGVVSNFLIIGAQKAGTTSLLRYLGAHPDIFVPNEKEVSAFYDDYNYNKRFETYPYEKYFESRKGEKFAGNGPVNLLYFSDNSAENIYKYNPSMKLIAILRNPIDRAYSAYWYFVRNGFEQESFESALDREKEVLKSGNFEQRANFTYISHGYYYEQLIPFTKIFSNDQLLILFFDDFKKDTKNVLKQIYEFLGIDKCYPDELIGKKFNVGSKSRIQSITNLIYRDHLLKNIYKSLISETIRQFISKSVFRRIRDLNMSPYSYPPIKPATREALQTIYQKPNEKLGDFLGRDLSGWN